MTNMGEGALRSMEGVADTASDLIFNPLERKINYNIDLITKGKKVADENYIDLQKMQERDIKKDLTKEFQNAVGYTDEEKKKWENDSLIKSSNFGGKFAQGVGGMVPALVLGGAAGGTPNLTDTSALTGKEKVLASLGNVGKTYAAQAPSNVMLGASSYGSGVEEALNEGATMDQARKYGVANAAIEQATEMLTSGVPGLKGKGGIDQFVDPLINKGSKGLVNAGLKYAYGAAGEGLEETAGTYLDALAKKFILGKDINWDEVNQEAKEAGLLGAATGATLNVGDLRDNVREQKAIKEQNSNVKEQKTSTKEQNEVIKPQNNTLEAQNKPLETQTQEAQQNIQEETNQPQIAENTPQTEEQPKRIIDNIDYSDAKYNNLSDEELGTLSKIYRNYKETGKMSVAENNTMNTLIEKMKAPQQQEVSTKNIKYPEINKNISKFEDVKEDYKKYSKSNLENFNEEILSKAKEVVQANKQGKRTKQEWLDVAKNIGLQADNMPAEQLKQYAFESFKAAQPNQKQNLNRQGQKYVSFGVEEWVKNVYEGAGVGNKLESRKDNVIVAKNNKGQQIKLKQDTKNPNVYKEEAVSRDLKDLNNQFKNKTIKAKDGREVSNFYSNITEKSKFIDTDIRNMFKNESDLQFYNKVSNEEALTKASNEIGKTAKSQEKAFDDFITKKEQFDSTDMAKGWVLLERFNQAGDYDRAYMVAKQMKEMGTKSGQAIQMLGLQSRLTPEGMYKWAVGELMEAEQKFNSEKGRTQKEIEKYRDSFKLTPEETEFINNQMKKVQKLNEMNESDTTTIDVNGKEKQVTVDRAKDIEIAKINSMLQDKLPHQKGQSLKSWMRMSMLLNPKTQVRNVAGNLIITPVNAVADVFAGGVDKLISKKTGEKTIGGPSLGGLASYGKGFVKGLKEATQDYRLGIETKDVNQDRFELGQGKAFNEQHTGPLKGIKNKIAKGLNATNDFLGYIMDAGDRAFYKGSVENSLYNQQKLNGSTEITDEMRQIAENEGLQRTWNDSNNYTKAVLDLRRSINQIGDQMHLHIGEYGLGDLIIPFAKTPANLTKAIVDYSPVGFVNAMVEGKNLKNAIKTGNYTPQMQHDFSQSVGKAVAGSLLYALGAALAKANITSGNSDDDKDLKNFMRYNLGIQPYSIKIGNKSFTYDWAQPIAAPFAITADIAKGLEENMTPSQAIQHFLTSGFNVLSEQSFLTGINEVLKDNDGILNGIEQQIVNIPATAIPTFLKQITDMFDGTKRQTYSKEGQISNMVKTAKSKDPKGTKELAPQVDVLGNEIKKYGGDNDVFNVFFNPANTEKGKRTPVAEEIYSLYEATQDKSIIPRKVDYSTKINGEMKTLTTKEMEKWQKASGKLVTKEVERAMSRKDYKDMDNDQKAEVINKIVNYSYQKAKSTTFNTPLAQTYNGVERARERGIPIADYYISKTIKNSMKRGD